MSDPQHLAIWGDSDYLDAVSAVVSVQLYKAHTYAALRPQPGARLLEVGCGNGDDALELARQVGPTGRVVGVDLREEMISQARRRAAERELPVEFVVGDIYSLEFPTDSFDGCRVDRVFQHLARPSEALAELVRVTRPGGYVVVFDVDWETLLIDAPDQQLTRAILNVACDEHANGWAGRALWRQFHAAGLQAIAIRHEGGAITDYTVASSLFGPSEMADAAVNAGRVNAEAARGWAAYLDDAARNGRFFSAVTGFTIVGQKPELGA